MSFLLSIIDNLPNIDDYMYIFVDLHGCGGSKEMQGIFSVEEASSDAMAPLTQLIKEKNFKIYVRIGD